MHFRVSLASLLLVAGLSAAHGPPRLFGRRGFVDLESLPYLGPVRRDPGPGGTCGVIDGVTYTCGTDANICCSAAGWCGDTTDHCGTGCQAAYGTCGIEPGTAECGLLAGNVSCAAGLCCGSDSTCANDVDHCEAPLCQEGFGSCQADAVPAGTNLSGNARPLLGDIPYGEDIYDCTVPGVIALTFDDGPGIYTDGMLDVLESYNAVASFMITGINNNKGEIDITQEWIDVINRTYNAGHQICSHTWSHQDLSTLTEAARRNEMYKNEMALVNIIGRWPTYMRPPYSSCDDACRATMKALGYHIMYFDIDTDDYDLDSPDLIQTAKNTFESYVGPSDVSTDDFLVIAHDIHQQTAQNLTAYMLETLIAKGYKPVTIGECLGDPEENWYRIPDGATRVSKTARLVRLVMQPSNPDPTPTQSPLPTNCVYTVNTWCATPLPTYTNIGGCWNSTGDCYPQGDVCYNSVGGADQTGCDAYDDVCAALENHCDACVSAAPSGQGDNAACQYVAPAYPTSVP